MKVRRTDFLTHNIRRETIPGLDEQTYFLLLFDEEAEVSAELGEVLISYNYVQEVK